MEYYLILARSVTYAQRMQRTLGRTGIRSQIFRAPRDLTDLGLRLCRAGRGKRPVQGFDRASQGVAGPHSGVFVPERRVPGGGGMIYLDSAATTFQKPRTVASAMQEA